jgi:hypothetical protein
VIFAKYLFLKATNLRLVIQALASTSWSNNNVLRLFLFEEIALPLPTKTYSRALAPGPFLPRRRSCPSGSAARRRAPRARSAQPRLVLYLRWGAGTATHEASGTPPAQGQKNTPWTPVVGGWVRGQKRSGSNIYFSYFMVFSNSPRRETPKNVMNENRETTAEKKPKTRYQKSRRKTGIEFFVDFLKTN